MHASTLNDVDPRHSAGAVAHEQQGKVASCLDEFLLFPVEAARQRQRLARGVFVDLHSYIFPRLRCGRREVGRAFRSGWMEGDERGAHLSRRKERPCEKAE